jgi:CDP-glycerol glycerophosphotransferase (TagB/SpsB family)
MMYSSPLRLTIKLLTILASGLAGWALIAPIALMMPRRRDLIVVIGMGEGRFIDNAKYFFLQSAPMLKPGVQVVFLAGSEELAAQLEGSGLATVRYPSWQGLWLLLRNAVAVVDSGFWLTRMRRFLLIGSKTVQLWHGANLKRIGLDKMRHEAASRAWLSSPLMMRLRMLNGALNGKLVRYDLMVSPSAFYEREVFRKAFLADKYLVAGYPRNTFGRFDDPALREAAWLNVDKAVRGALASWAVLGRRIVLVAPTFRDSRATSLGIDTRVMAMLDAWCEQNRAELVFKFHPFERGTGSVSGRHLHVCGVDTDVYPLLPHSDALVTDYSSIYMDYLLLDRPVCFFVPDLEDYVRSDRQFQFDFDEMTPGPKAHTWQQLLWALEEQWRDDGYKLERARLRKLAFDDLDPHAAVPALIAFMRGRGWIADARASA